MSSMHIAACDKTRLDRAFCLWSETELAHADTTDNDKRELSESVSDSNP